MLTKLGKPWFKFNGILNEDMGVLMESMPVRQLPALNGTKTKIPNRHGIVLVSDGTYGTVNVKLSVIIPNISDYAAAYNWLMNTGELEFFDRAGYAYDAMALTAVQTESPVNRLSGQRLTITYTCQPFLHVPNEDDESNLIKKSSSGTIIGDGHIASSPWIHLTGNANSKFSIDVNGTTITVDLQSQSYTGCRIDCDAKIVYLEYSSGKRVSLNEYTYVDNWITLLPNGHENIITLKEGTKNVEILPRWRWF